MAGQPCSLLTKKQEYARTECLGVASVITFGCSHTSSLDLGMTLIEGYVHGDANIRLGPLKRWLPMNHRELPELLGSNSRRYCPKENNTTNDTHRIPLFEIFSTKPCENGQWTVNGFGWITSETATNPHIKTMNMQASGFLRATVRLPPGKKLEDVLEDQNTRQTTSMQAASYIAYSRSDALGPDSEHRRAV